jgi:hypothetical protein
MLVPHDLLNGMEQCLAAAFVRCWARVEVSASSLSIAVMLLQVRNMVRAFRSQGYELVVFLDCAIPDEKLTTWYRRR